MTKKVLIPIVAVAVLAALFGLEQKEQRREKDKDVPRKLSREKSEFAPLGQTRRREPEGYESAFIERAREKAKEIAKYEHQAGERRPEQRDFQRPEKEPAPEPLEVQEEAAYEKEKRFEYPAATVEKEAISGSAGTPSGSPGHLPILSHYTSRPEKEEEPKKSPPNPAPGKPAPGPTPSAPEKDTAAPLLSLDFASKRVLPGSQVFLSCEAGSSVEISIKDSKLIESCPGQGVLFFAAPTEEGRHKIEVSSKDRAGNVSRKSAELEIDASGPKARSAADFPWLTALSGMKTNSDAVEADPLSFAFAGDEQVLEILKKNESGFETVATLQKGYLKKFDLPLAKGANQFYARLTDDLGNQGEMTPVLAAIDQNKRELGLAIDENDGFLSSLEKLAGKCPENTRVALFAGGQELAQKSCQEEVFFFLGSGLPEGDLSLRIKAFDEYGNTAEKEVSLAVDNTAPALTMEKPADAVQGVFNGEARVAGSCSPEDSPVTLVVETPETSAKIEGIPCLPTGEWNFSDPGHTGSGVLTFEAAQSDEAGNKTTVSASMIIHPDDTAPEVALEQPAPVEINTHGSFTVQGQCDASEGPVGIAFGSGEGQSAHHTQCLSGSFSLELPVPAQPGTYQISAHQSDANGNTGSAAVELAVNPDATAPQVDLDAPGQITQGESSLVSLSGSCDSLEGEVEIFLGQIYQGQAQCLGGVFSFQLAAPAPGVHALEARQADLAGNVGSDSDSLTVNPDVTAPALDLNKPTDALQGETSDVVLGGSCDDSESSVSVKLADLEQNANCSSGVFSARFNISALPPGSYQVTASQSDVYGNQGEDSEIFVITADTTAPVVVLNQPASRVQGEQHPAELSGSCDPEEGKVSLEGQLSSLPAQVDCVDGLFELQLPAALENPGEYAITARQSDAFYNIGSDTKILTIAADTAAPAVDLDKPASADQGDKSAAFSGSCEDGESLVFVTLESQTVTAECSNQSFSVVFSLPPLQPGVYLVQAEQVDIYGNLGSDTEEFTIAADTTAPLIELEQPQSALQGETLSASFGGSCESSEGPVTIKGDLSGLPAQAECLNGAFAIDLPLGEAEPGEYPVTAEQSDAYGNTGSSVKIFTVEPDTAAPEVVLNQPEEVLQGGESPVFSGSCESGGSHVTVMIDGHFENAQCEGGTFSAKWEASELAPGEHTVRAFQADAYGNLGSNEKLLTVVADTAAPEVSLEPFEAFVQGERQTLEAQGQCDSLEGAVSVELAGETFQTACEEGLFSLQLDVSGLAPGVHEVLASQSDAYGNIGSDSKELQVVADTVAPELTLSPVEDFMKTAKDDVAISGQCEEGLDVSIVFNGSGGKVSCLQGSYSATFSVRDLAAGTYTVAASQVDQYGNESNEAESFEITPYIDFVKEGFLSQLRDIELRQNEIDAIVSAGGSGDSVKHELAAERDFILERKYQQVLEKLNAHLQGSEHVKSPRYLEYEISIARKKAAIARDLAEIKAQECEASGSSACLSELSSLVQKRDSLVDAYKSKTQTPYHCSAVDQPGCVWTTVCEEAESAGHAWSSGTWGFSKTDTTLYCSESDGADGSEVFAGKVYNGSGLVEASHEEAIRSHLVPAKGAAIERLAPEMTHMYMIHKDHTHELKPGDDIKIEKDWSLAVEATRSTDRLVISAGGVSAAFEPEPGLLADGKKSFIIRNSVEIKKSEGYIVPARTFWGRVVEEGSPWSGKIELKPN